MSNRLDGLMVLLIDDQHDNIVVAQTTLEYHGATVYVAENGEEGLAILETILPNIILLDLSMPVMNGWEMFDKIREDTSFSRVPIIAVTAHAMDGDRQRVLDYGFDDYISKPYDIHSLVEHILFVIKQKSKEFRNG